jgi:hypothetical protein
MITNRIVFGIALSLIFFSGVCSAPMAHARYPLAETKQADIQLEFDASAARTLLDLLERKEVSDEEIQRVITLPGTQAMIKQASRFDPAATADNFKLSLRRIVETGVSESDPFRLTLVKSRLPLVRALLKRIESNPRVFVDAVTSRMREYAPDNVSLKSKVYFIVGGTSDGFAPTKDEFYIALHYYGDDYDGLKALMAHELFHHVQATIRSARATDKPATPPPANVTNSLAILSNTVNEGTASMVGDALLLPGGKQYSDFFKAKYKKNLDRIKSNFALFEALLYRAYNDPGADFGQLNNLGFSGTWDSPLYFVGYRMGKVIEKYKGKEAIKASVGRDPLEFFNQYIEIYQKQNDPEIIKLSKPCEEILRKLQELLDKPHIQVKATE